MILTSVDLPAPLSPSSATTSPAETAKETPRNASIAPKLLRMSISSSSGASAKGRPIFGRSTNRMSDRTVLLQVRIAGAGRNPLPSQAVWPATGRLGRELAALGVPGPSAVARCESPRDLVPDRRADEPRLCGRDSAGVEIEALMLGQIVANVDRGTRSRRSTASGPCSSCRSARSNSTGGTCRLGTDTMLAHAVALAAAERVPGVAVLPPPWYGFRRTTCAFRARSRCAPRPWSPSARASSAPSWPTASAASSSSMATAAMRPSRQVPELLVEQLKERRADGHSNRSGGGAGRNSRLQKFWGPNRASRGPSRAVHAA